MKRLIILIYIIASLTTLLSIGIFKYIRNDVRQRQDFALTHKTGCVCVKTNEIDKITYMSTGKFHSLENGQEVDYLKYCKSNLRNVNCDPIDWDFGVKTQAILSTVWYDKDGVVYLTLFLFFTEHVYVVTCIFLLFGMFRKLLPLHNNDEWQDASYKTYIYAALISFAITTVLLLLNLVLFKFRCIPILNCFIEF